MFDLLGIVKFLEENQMAATFWFKKGESVTGVPSYEGFDIDTGELIKVNDRTIAMHDFRSLIIVNKDNWFYREHHAGPERTSSDDPL